MLKQRALFVTSSQLLNRSASHGQSHQAVENGMSNQPYLRNREKMSLVKMTPCTFWPRPFLILHRAMFLGLP